MKQILLAKLYKDYISLVENSSDFRLSGNTPYQQAVQNLEEDAELWSAQLGVSIKLESRREPEEESYDLDGKTVKSTRYNTCLYALVEDDDFAWMTLNLGTINPSSRLTSTEQRGWCFAWL